MRQLELTRLAVEALGETATPADIADYTATYLGEPLDPRFISLYRATLRRQEQQRLAREAAVRILEEARLEPPVKKRKVKAGP